MWFIYIEELQETDLWHSMLYLLLGCDWNYFTTSHSSLFIRASEEGKVVLLLLNNFILKYVGFFIEFIEWQ